MIIGEHTRLACAVRRLAEQSFRRDAPAAAGRGGVRSPLLSIRAHELRSLAKSRRPVLTALRLFGRQSSFRRVGGVGDSRFVGHQSPERQMVEGRSSSELSRMGFLPDGRRLEISARLYVEAELPVWDPHRLHRLDADRRGCHEIILKASAVHLSVSGTRRFRELHPPGLLWIQDRIRTLQRSLARGARERLLHTRAAIRSANRLSLFPFEPVANPRKFVALSSL